MISIHMNASSLLAQRQLGAAHSSIATSLERLSTGFKINRASDNAANLAISKRMSSQLSGTTVAIDNALQGINLLDTADGALANMTEKVNRIRDLCLQSMNGIYSDDERLMMQQEVDKLTAEIYREKNSTTFNNIQLFEAQQNAPPDSGGGGSPPDGATAASEIQTLNAGATDEVAAISAVNASEKQYDYQVEYISWPSNTSERDYCIELGSFGDYDAIDYTFTSTNTRTTDVLLGKNLSTAFIGYDSANKISMKYRGNNTGFTVSENITATQKGDGTRKTLHFEYNLDGDTNSVMTIGGYNPSTYSQEKQIHQIKCYKDGELVRDFIPVVDKNGVACMYDKVSGQLFYNKGTKEFTAGPKIKEPEPPTPPEEPTPTPAPTFRPGDVMLQVGANSGVYNQMGIDLTFDMSGFTADISTAENASQTLEQMDKFKDLLINKRSHVGAQRNRLESVINASTLRKENLASSHSTMMDTDFASETAKLARQQILKQASASLLAQANTQNNLALSLLNL